MLNALQARGLYGTKRVNAMEERDCSRPLKL